MADATTFNVADGYEVERKMLVLCANTGTYAAPVWEIIGSGVEDSAISFNPDLETTTDILGVTRTRINKLEPTQDMSMPLIGGSDFLVKVHNDVRRRRLANLGAYDLLVIYGYVGAAATYEADRFPASTIEPTSLGGDAFVDQEVTFHLGGTIAYGTVNAFAVGSTVTFTPEA